LPRTLNIRIGGTDSTPHYLTAALCSKSGLVPAAENMAAALL
jgi:hypothetical protein